MSKQTQTKQAPKKKPAPRGPIAAGERVKWTSQASGSATEKRGAVLGYVPKGQTIRSVLQTLGRREAEDYGTWPQRSAVYVVAVEGSSRLYTPFVSTLEKQNPRAKRTPAS